VKCSVIIPTRSRPSLLRYTLESLSQQNENDFEVIVVVDGECPKTRSLADTYKAPYSLRWIFEQENRGLPSARNRGAMAAESDILLFLDDDTTPAAGWLHHHLKHHQSDDTCCETGIYGKVIDKYARPPASQTERFMRDSRIRDLASFEAHVRNQSLEFSKVVAFGINTSVRRQTFFALGGFDPYLNFVDEDADFGARLYNRGVQFKFEPDAVVYHHDTKDILEYHDAILRRAGRFDVYRRREKQQCNGRQLLAQFYCRSRWRRLVHRVAWYFPWIFRLAASACRKVTDTTGSNMSYRIGFKMGVGEYWEGVREAGETPESLRTLYPQPAPILMLHSVAAPTEKNLWSYYLSPGRFSRFMRWMKRADYESALPTEWSAGTSANRRVILTFDDAYDDFLSEAFPVLEHLGFKATVFVVVDRIGKTNEWDGLKGFPSRRLLTLSQIRDLYRHGVHIGSHTLTHPCLTTLSDGELEREVSDSKHKLEDLLGSEVPCFSYPWGAADMRVRAAVARAGYKVAVTTQEGLNCSEDPLSLKRINVCEVDTLLEFALKLATGKDYRQKARDFLVRKGIHRRPVQPDQK
jgi:GT2 family glycosyltransferase/peptidoglycan/xylan/chitin deacetylase (PgdA/CDA1 family)